MSDVGQSRANQLRQPLLSLLVYLLCWQLPRPSCRANDFLRFSPAAAAATVLRANAVKCSPTHPSFLSSLSIARIGFEENTWIEIASAAENGRNCRGGQPQGRSSRRPSVRRQNTSGAGLRTPYHARERREGRGRGSASCKKRGVNL